MNDSKLERAHLLLQMRRPQEAVTLLLGVLSTQPENPTAHQLLAEAWLELGEKKKALESARQAQVHAPDHGAPHAMEARVLLALNRPKEARVAAQEAVRIEPLESAHHAALAAGWLALREWEQSLQVADEGLRQDPEDVGCEQIRAIALRQLGRTDLATSSLEGTLQRDPENARSHANQGWNYLQQGDEANALIHFREALKIDPEEEWAARGIIEALKAKHRVYRWLLRFQFWISSFQDSRQMAIIMAGGIGYFLMTRAMAAIDGLAPFLILPIVAYLGFVFLTWFGNEVFNAILLTHRYGRLIVPRDEKIATAIILGVFGLGLGFAVTGILQGSSGIFSVGFCLGLLALPIQPLFVLQPRTRGVMGGFILLLLGLAGLIIDKGFETDRRRLEMQAYVEQESLEDVAETRRLEELSSNRHLDPDTEPARETQATEPLSSGESVLESTLIETFQEHENSRKNWIATYSILCFFISQLLSSWLARWPERG